MYQFYPKRFLNLCHMVIVQRQELSFTIGAFPKPIKLSLNFRKGWVLDDKIGIPHVLYFGAC